MQDISTQMISGYRAHPKFSFPAPSWEIPSDVLDTFNQAYSVIHAMGYKLTEKSFGALRRSCSESLAAIFSAMHAQCADGHETHFLNELKGQCDRLLAEELAWYGKKRPAMQVDLSPQANRENALLLDAQRHYFGQLPKAAVDELRAIAAEQVDIFRANAAAGKLTRNDLSVNTGPVVARIRAVLNREFKALGVMDALGAYTGRKLKVVGLALELSVPQATWWRNAIDGMERPPDTLYAHLDETVSCPKSIVYLTDVRPENGATSCYPKAYEAMRLSPLQELIGRVVGYIGANANSPLHEYYAKNYHQSVNSERFRRHFMRLPDALRFNSHMGWDVVPGSELEAALAAQEMTMTGPAGTFIIFDGGRLFHRGGMVQQGERVALQVIFSDLTLPQRVLGKLTRMMA